MDSGESTWCTDITVGFKLDDDGAEDDIILELKKEQCYFQGNLIS